MFKKSVIMLFFLSTVSHHVYTMNQINPDEYASCVAQGQANIYLEALNYANDLAQNKTENFDEMYKNSTQASNIYSALIKKHYQDAYEPALKFAGNLYSYEGTSEVGISAFGGIPAEYFIDGLQDALQIQTKLACWILAAEIYIALITHAENGMLNLQELYSTGLECADTIFKITKQYINHNQTNLYDSLTEKAVEIYTNLIGRGYEQAYQQGQNIAHVLCQKNTNVSSKISASLIYVALIKAKFNFDEICSKALEFAQPENNGNNIRVIFIIYDALVNCKYEQAYEQISTYIQEKEYPKFSFDDFEIKYVSSICVGLIHNEVKSACDHLTNYADSVLGYYTSFSQGQLSQVMPIFEALDQKGLLKDYDLAAVKQWMNS